MNFVGLYYEIILQCKVQKHKKLETLALFLEEIGRKNLPELPTPIPQNSIVSGY